MLHTLESVLGELQATQPKATTQLRDQWLDNRGCDKVRLNFPILNTSKDFYLVTRKLFVYQ